LEIHLYYKYPEDLKDGIRLQRFFGDETIPPILLDRINNEMSHLSGGLERGALPVEVPEMKQTAQAILNRLKTLDEEQYNSLLKSVGIEITA